MLREIQEVRKKIAALSEEENDRQRDELEDELLELLKLDEFAKQRIIDYKTDHSNLYNQPDTIILTLDFTSAQTSMDTDFNDCVVVIATQTPLVIPPALAEHLVAAEKPSSFIPKPCDSAMDSEEEEEELLKRPKKPKRTKKEMDEQEIEYAKPRDNLRTDINQYKKRNQLPAVCFHSLLFIQFSLSLFTVRWKRNLIGNHSSHIFIFCRRNATIEDKFLLICNGF